MRKSRSASNGSPERFPNGAELRRVLTPTTPWAERDRLPKDNRINVRVSATEKAEMAKTAEVFGLGVSEYLLRLHRLTVAIQGGEGGRRRVRGIPKGKPS